MLNELNLLLEDAKKLPPREDNFEKLPDGEYKAVIIKAEFKTSKKGDYMFVWEFIVSEGDYTSRHEWKYSMLNSSENMQRLTTDLNKFGVNTESMENIEKDLDVLIDVPVMLTVTSKPSKTNPETIYRNVSVKPCNS